MNSLVLGQFLEGSKVLIKLPISVQKATLPRFGIDERVYLRLLAKGSPAEVKVRDELTADHLSFKKAFSIT